MIRKYLIQQYIGVGPEAVIIWHHGSIHMRMAWRVLLLLVLLWWISTTIFSLRWMMQIFQWILTTLIILIYGYFLLQFLNDYLDALISTERGLTLFRRDGLLQYSVQQFERDKIEMISFVQDSLSDKILNKWDIVINLDHGVSFRIEQMGNPQKLVNMLRSMKWQYTQSLGNHVDEQDNHDKFNILVETLGEVIKDYMDRDHRQSPPRLM